MIECSTNDVHAAVDDAIDLRADGAVLLERQITFHTDSRTDRPFRYFHKELLGGCVSTDADIEGADSTSLVVVAGRTPDYLIIEVDPASVSESTTVRVVVRSELLPPSCDSPLTYTVGYSAPQNVYYSVAIRPFIPELTEDVRFTWTVEPTERLQQLHRDGTTGEVHLGSSVRISNATPPISIECVHAEELPSTRLLRYYRQKFTG
jgi:hypothetical protein